MTIQQLDAALAIAGTTLTLTDATLPGAGLGRLLTAYNGGSPLIINGAAKQVAADAVTVTGTSSFMRVPDTVVTAVFTIGEGGAPVARIRFVLPSASAPTPWKFSQSFTDLPPFSVIDSTGLKQATFLDMLVFDAAAFVLATQSGVDSDSQAPLETGLNFVGTLRLTGLLGVLQSLAPASGTATLYGTITTPTQEPAAPPLTVDTYPWQTGVRVPGILLTADLPGTWTISKLTVDTLRYRIYSPPTKAWTAANNTYQTVAAIGGRLSIPSANVTADVSAVTMVGSSTTLIVALFPNTPLPGLDALADAANGSDLFALLPARLKDLGPSLQGLYLQAVGVSFSGGITSLNVGYVTLTVGMPNASWSVIDGKFVLSAPTAQFFVTSPFDSARGASVILSGMVTVSGVPLSASTTVPTFDTRVRLADTETIPLTKLFDDYLPSLAPALDTTLHDVSVDLMDLVVHPAGGYQFEARLADETPWKIDVGPTGLTISSVHIEAAAEAGGQSTASFGGSLQIGELGVVARYTLPETFYIRADFPAVTLTHLIETMSQIPVTLPKGFDLSLPAGYMLIEGGSGQRRFTVAGLVDNVDLLAFTAQNSGGQWGFAAGLQTTSVASLPGLGIVAPIEKAVGLEDLMVVVSSLSDPGFTFPDMANFNASALAGRQIKLPPQANGVVAGFNAYARISSTNNVALRTLAAWLGLKLDGTVGITLSVSAPDPAQNSKLFIAVNQQVSAGMHLIGAVGLLLLGDNPGGFLDGTLTTTLGGKTLTFDTQAQVFANGILVSGNARATDGGAQGAVVTIGPVQLAGLGLAIGMDLEGIPSVGIAATIDVGNFESSLAVFINSVDPASSLVAGAIDAVSLADFAQSIAGQASLPPEVAGVMASIALRSLPPTQLSGSDGTTLTTALGNRDLAGAATVLARYGIRIPAGSQQVMLIENTPGSVWHLTDMTQNSGGTMTHYRVQAGGGTVTVVLQPQFYFAPQPVSIGSTVYPKGFSIAGEIDFLVVRAHLKVAASAGRGILADVAVDKIVLGNPDFFSIADSAGTGGPLLSLATFSDSSRPDPRLQGPHALLTGAVRVLGTTVAGVYLELDSKGLKIDVTATVPVASCRLQGSVTGANQMSASGKASVGINRQLDLGPLGRVQVDTTVGGTIGIAFDGTATAWFAGAVDFQGISAQIPRTTLAVSGPVLANLADTLWAPVSDIVRKALGDANTWLSFVGRKLITGIDTSTSAIGNVLASQFHLSPPDIANATRSVLAYGPDQIAQALRGAGVPPDTAATVLNGMGYAANVVTSAIKGAFAGLHADVNLGHVDTPAGPHVDTPKAHVDTPNTHVDGSKWGIHGDVGAPHVDQTTPHADTQVPPHVDTGTHIDT